MNLSAEDRVALILGRAIHRAEILQAAVEELEREVAALRAQVDASAPPPTIPDDAH